MGVNGVKHYGRRNNVRCCPAFSVTHKYVQTTITYRRLRSGSTTPCQYNSKWKKTKTIKLYATIDGNSTLSNKKRRYNHKPRSRSLSSMPAARTNSTPAHNTNPLSRNRSRRRETTSTANDVIELSSDEELSKPARRMRRTSNNTVADLRDVSADAEIIG